MYDLDVNAGYKRSGSLGSLDVTAANETLKVQVPIGVLVTLLQAKDLTQRYSSHEVWYPVGLWYTVTTDVAAAAATVVLRQNGASPLSGGTATISAATASTNEVFKPFSSWRFATPPSPGDQWSILVTVVSDTTGVINPIALCYVVGSAIGITDGTQQ